jgi:hypothetical protein
VKLKASLASAEVSAGAVAKADQNQNCSIGKYRFGTAPGFVDLRPVRIWRGLGDANEAVYHVTTWHQTANITGTEECIFLTRNMSLQLYFLSFMIEDPIIPSLLNILSNQKLHSGQSRDFRPGLDLP